MGPEAASPLEPERRVPEPHVLLQESLGVSEEVARDLASVQVMCPKPGEDRQSSLAEFMTSPHGAGKAEQIIDIAREARESGADPEEALQRALGFAAIKDKETGRLLRVDDAEPTAPAADPLKQAPTEKEDKPNDEEPPRPPDDFVDKVHIAEREGSEPSAELPAPAEEEAVRRETETVKPAETTEDIEPKSSEHEVDEAEIRHYEQQPTLIDMVVVESEGLVGRTATAPKIPESLIVKTESAGGLINEPPSKPLQAASIYRGPRSEEPPIAQADEAPAQSEKKVEIQSITLIEETPDPEAVTLPAGIIAETVLSETAEQPPELCPAETLADTPLVRERKTVFPADELLLDLRYIMQSGNIDDEIISDPALSEQVILPEITELIHEMSEVLESLEPAETQAVQVVAAQMTEAAEQILMFREAGQDSAEAEEILQTVCERLLDELNVSYSKESVEQLARLILVAHEARREMAVAERPENETLADTDKGTHEFKLGQLTVPMLVHRAKQKFVPLRALGKRALTGNLAPA
ncbi:MAG TPA: hypothetical protein VFH99_01765 [Candidatus Saccharimonadales bacterium]|nr:hypothetical protein [Candidatus Saccharimonadales bacterium]